MSTTIKMHLAVLLTSGNSIKMHFNLRYSVQVYTSERWEQKLNDCHIPVLDVQQKYIHAATPHHYFPPLSGIYILIPSRLKIIGLEKNLSQVKRTILVQITTFKYIQQERTAELISSHVDIFQGSIHKVLLNPSLTSSTALPGIHRQEGKRNL